MILFPTCWIIWSAWDTSERMERWGNVILWETGENRGRVRYARFFMFNTDDGIPYQVSWLNAAEELVFYSNENNNLREDIILGDAITELRQLKRLTLSAYGLDDGSLSDKFYTSFPELEFLDLSSNNFSKIPEGINKENFPKLDIAELSKKKVLTLRDAQKTAIANNPDYIAAYHAVSAAKFRYYRSLSAYLPTVDLNMSVGQSLENSRDLRNPPEGVVPRENHFSTDIGLRASYLIFDGLAREFAALIAQKEYKKSVAEDENIKRLLIHQGLMGVFHHDPFIPWIAKRQMAFEGNLGGFPLGDVPQVNHVPQHFRNGGAGPFLPLGVGAYLQSIVGHAAVYRRRGNALFVEALCNFGG